VLLEASARQNSPHCAIPERAFDAFAFHNCAQGRATHSARSIGGAMSAIAWVRLSCQRTITPTEVGELCTPCWGIRRVLLRIRSARLRSCAQNTSLHGCTV